ncbi:DUF7260 family protein [Natronorubrum halophilum]|uniref:DUF7260 family protein n=1 Tax=Natronorubrum halophilum TaxID=1702106 RepID=UPI0010C20A44|nr:hypothetical protein [Natronorubrum halophilum]
MSITTHVHEALERVNTKREEVAETVTAVDRFARRVDEIRPVSPVKPTGGGYAADGGVVAAATRSRPRPPTNRCQDVRELFAETIYATSTDADVDRADSLQTTISDELGQEIALLLSPETDRRFTPDVKGAVLTVTRKRRAELKAVDEALSTEADSLRSAVTALETVTDWLTRVNEIPLSELGFDDLRSRHEALSSHRDRCRQALQDRQAVLHGTTKHHAAAGVPHQSLVSSLYRPFPTAYPVVVTLCRLEECCADCQRTVRDHLTRRA